MRSKCTPDQMSADWNNEVGEAEVISTWYKIGEDGTERHTTLRHRGRGRAMRIYGVEGRTRHASCERQVSPRS